MIERTPDCTKKIKSQTVDPPPPGVTRSTATVWRPNREGGQNENVSGKEGGEGDGTQLISACLVSGGVGLLVRLGSWCAAWGVLLGS